MTKLIAEHWADGPDSTFPPGHWFRIGMEAAVNQVGSIAVGWCNQLMNSVKAQALVRHLIYIVVDAAGRNQRS